MRNVQLWVYGVDRGLRLLDQAPPGQGVCWGEGGGFLPGIFTEGRCRAPICADYFLKPRPALITLSCVPPITRYHDDTPPQPRPCDHVSVCSSLLSRNV